MSLSLTDRLAYSPLLAQLVIIRRCNLSCAYCGEHDKTGLPVPANILDQRLEWLRELGTFTVSLTGGEPMLHPDLFRLVVRCRHLGFWRTELVTNGFLLRPDVIEQLNEAGLQEMHLAVDGVFANATTQKVLNNLQKRLEWLGRWARFNVTVSAVVGACRPDEVQDVLHFARELGFQPQVTYLHNSLGRLHLRPEDLQAVHRLGRGLPLPAYQRRLVRAGSAPFRCRAGSRTLYVDEHGQVARCSQTRGQGSKPLAEYGPADLREQFYAYKPCQATCSLADVRFASRLDRWRRQDPPPPTGGSSIEE